MKPESPAMSLTPAVFWDRDGVVNACPGAGYVLSWPDFHFSPGIIPALQLCRQRGYLLILATSQQGVGKGLMTQAELDAIHQHMQAELAAHGAAFDAIYACTCLSTDPGCTCRKPSPEMLLKAATEHGIDLPRSLMIGDADRDILMAQNAGVLTTIRVRSRHAIHAEATHTLDDTTQLTGLLAALL
jgi:D-glycero-D-manno-heptose 1,7-bisphosphate phosphatase